MKWPSMLCRFYFCLSLKKMNQGEKKELKKCAFLLSNPEAKSIQGLGINNQSEWRRGQLEAIHGLLSGAANFLLKAAAVSVQQLSQIFVQMCFVLHSQTLKSASSVQMKITPLREAEARALTISLSVSAAGATAKREAWSPRCRHSQSGHPVTTPLYHAHTRLWFYSSGNISALVSQCKKQTSQKI